SRTISPLFRLSSGKTALVTKCEHLLGDRQANETSGGGGVSGSCWRKIAISDNVGGVKQFSSTLQHALIEERHFALVEAVAFALPT
ncbi:MAG: hypothetical protein ACREMY_03415, partial [bacterium]